MRKRNAKDTEVAPSPTRSKREAPVRFRPPFPGAEAFRPAGDEGAPADPGTDAGEPESSRPAKRRRRQRGAVEPGPDPRELLSLSQEPDDRVVVPFRAQLEEIANGYSNGGGGNGHHPAVEVITDQGVLNQWGVDEPSSPASEEAAGPPPRRRGRKVAQPKTPPAEPNGDQPTEPLASEEGDTASITTEQASAAAAEEARLGVLRKVIAPAWGRKLPEAGRAAHVAAMPEFQATTSQACGLYGFVAGSGSPSIGVPMGFHQMDGEIVCYDPISWVLGGLTVNPGCVVFGQPGVGKSVWAKRLLRGMAGFGITPWVLGDLKPDYSAQPGPDGSGRSGVIHRLGGTIIRVGRGLDRINPLDTGPLGQAAAAMKGAAHEHLKAEIRGRRLNALLALLSLVRDYRISNGEENILGVILDILDERMRNMPPGPDAQPTVPMVLEVLRSGEEMRRLIQAADVVDEFQFQVETKNLRQTLNLLCQGSLKGVFDGPTSKPIDLNAPAVAIDISAVSSAGDTVVAAAMLSTWAMAFSSIDGAAALADAKLAPRRQFVTVIDEAWRALRSPGTSGTNGSALVEHADALTRVNRTKGVGDIRLTHSLADFEAVGNASDRAKARGFVERASVIVLGALPMRELRAISEVVPLTNEEMQLVSGWSDSESWKPGVKHRGRGMYLLKAGGRVGIPIQMELVGDEAELYDTDINMRAGT